MFFSLEVPKVELLQKILFIPILYEDAFYFFYEPPSLREASANAKRLVRAASRREEKNAKSAKVGV